MKRRIITLVLSMSLVLSASGATFAGVSEGSHVAPKMVEPKLETTVVVYGVSEGSH